MRTVEKRGAYLGIRTNEAHDNNICGRASVNREGVEEERKGSVPFSRPWLLSTEPISISGY